MLFVTPAYWFTGVWYRRMRVLTLGDYFSERFNSKLMGGVYSFFGSIALMILLSVGFIGITKTVMIMTPKDVTEFTEEERVEYQQAKRLDELETLDYASLTLGERHEMEELRALDPSENFSHINKTMFIWIIVVVVIIYAVIGGLEAAFVSDVIQGIFILILSVLLLPFALSKINLVYGSKGVMGAFETIHQQLPESFFEIFGSPATMDFTWYYIAAISLLAMINVMVGANQLVATGSAKNEYVARYGFTFGTYLKRLTIVLWGVTALAITLLYAHSIKDPDLLWGYASYELLGPLNLGLIGLMIAALMAALMSTADMMMITTSGLITHNLFRPFFPGLKEKQYVNIGRALGAIVVIGAAIMVMHSDSILNALKANWEWNVVVAAGFWLGILWRRTNRKAVWASMITAFTLFYVIPMALPAINPDIYYNQYLLKQTDEVIIDRTYTAHEQDVRDREKEISRWERLNTQGEAIGPKPEPIQTGEEFIKRYKQPQRSIFWTQDITYDEEGRRKAQGTMKITLVIYDMLGFDLSQNKYAFNETLKVLTKLIIPFLIVIIVSLLTKHPKDEEEVLDRFYVKMKTPVSGDKEFDDRELQLSYENPRRFDHTLLFPKTQWQFTKWTRMDSIGFTMCILMIFAILGLLYFFVHLGGAINF